MPHNVRTSIATDPNGQITGYGISVEAELESGAPDEIHACIAASLDMIRTAIQEQLIAAIGHASTLAPTQPAEEAPPAEQPADDGTAAAPTQRTYQPPRTPAEAEQRFYARYGPIIGGESWLDVRAYLGRSHARPRTIEGWIEAAEAVRDKHTAEQAATAAQAERAATAPAPTRRSARRAA